MTITGTDFTGATEVNFGRTALAAGRFTVQNDTLITATSPAAPSRGPVHVTVTTQAGTSATSPADQFTYTVVPTVTRVNPARGPVAGGTRVTITGTGFTDANGASAVTAVNFGAAALAAGRFTVQNDTSITATSPAAPSRGPVHVTVTTPAGTSATRDADQFTYPRGVLFHQNMRVYGGGAPNRNTAYRTAFTAIRARLVGPPVLIAGFTELKDNDNAVTGLNGGLRQALDVGPVQAVCTRRTALGGVDFTGIAVAAGVNIRSWGRVIPLVSGGSATLIHDVFNPPNTRTITWPDPARPPQVTHPNLADWAAALPEGVTLDYQSFVYVVAEMGPVVFAVAFLHNVYTIMGREIINVALQAIPAAVGLIAANPAMGGAGVVYICGDFNAGPSRRGTLRQPVEPFAQRTISGGPAPLWSPNAILTPAQGRAGGTTAAGSLYDYSFRSVIGNPPAQFMEPPEPAIDVETLGQGPNWPLSDHAASLLII